MRSKAKEWGIDPNRIGMLGFSAGGNLTARAATNFDRRSYEPVDDTDKVSCRPDFGVLVYPGLVVQRDKPELMDDIRVSAETPPCQNVARWTSIFWWRRRNSPIDSGWLWRGEGGRQISSRSSR